MGNITKKTRAPRIEETADYARFTSSRGNRPVDTGGRRALRQSMERYGWLAAFPMMVRRDGDMLVIVDGQHRFAIAQEMGLPVRYVAEERDIDVALINNGCSTWKHADYASSWAQRGNAEYQKLIDFSAANGVSLGIGVALLDGTGYVQDNTAAMRRFKDGQFKVREGSVAQADRICAIIREARALKRAPASSSFIRAAMLCCALPEFDDERFRKNLTHCPEKFLAFSGLDAVLTMFEDIYNHRQRMLFPLRVAVANAAKEAKEKAAHDERLIAERAARRREAEAERLRRLENCAGRVAEYAAARRAPTSVLIASRALGLPYRLITEAARAFGLYTVRPGGYIIVKAEAATEN